MFKKKVRKTYEAASSPLLTSAHHECNLFVFATPLRSSPLLTHPLAPQPPTPPQANPSRFTSVGAHSTLYDSLRADRPALVWLDS